MMLWTSGSCFMKYRYKQLHGSKRMKNDCDHDYLRINDISMSANMCFLLLISCCFSNSFTHALYFWGALMGKNLLTELFNFSLYSELAAKLNLRTKSTAENCCYVKTWILTLSVNCKTALSLSFDTTTKTESLSSKQASKPSSLDTLKPSSVVIS